MPMIRRALAVITTAIFALPLQGQTFLGPYTSYEVAGKAITVHAGLAGVRFMFYAPDIVRVDYLPGPSSIIDSTFVVIRDTSALVPFSVADSSASLAISTSGLTIMCAKSPLRLRYYDASGRGILSEGATGGFWSNGSSRAVSFQVAAEDHYYGTGERGTALDKRGQFLTSYNVTIGGYTSPLPQMNINVPFVASPRGYAIYFEDTYPGQFDFGNTNPSLFTYTALGGELSCYLIAAPTVPEQLERYTWLTGRQPLPPRWAFGYIQSKFGYQTETEARGIVQTMRSSQIPCDAIILDLYWYAQMGDLWWNFSAFPQPWSMMQDFQRQGIKTIVITEPYISQYSLTYAEASSNTYVGTNNSGQPYLLSNWWSCGCNALLLDPTLPAAQAWWWQKYPVFMGIDSAGVAGLWTDLCEPERHPADMVHALGSADRVHNVYNLFWARSIFEGFNAARPGQRLFNLTRSGYAGIQRYGVIPWSGDVGKAFGGLAVQQPMLLNMGMSGLAYHNSDIGGFCCGTTTDELYVRWMQYGTFCPITRAHGVGQGTEPWAFSAGAEAIATTFIRLRYQLLPYIYTMAYENYSSGMPLARPLFFESPDDPTLGNESESYMWGDALVVSPVVQASQTSKTVHLPQGRWFDFWTDNLVQGGTATVATPLATMPIFVKAGSIIPMQPVMNYTDERPLDTLMLAVYPVTGVPGQFTLYEDDGSTLAYQSGSFARTVLSQTSAGSGSGATLTLSIGQTAGTYSGKPGHRVYLSEVHGVSTKPALVRCNGVDVPEASSYQTLRQGGNGFYFDPVAAKLYVQTPTVPDSSYLLSVEGVSLTGVRGSLHHASGFTLDQNYPNPFNPTTDITFHVSGGTGQATRVQLKVYDILGREVTTLVDGKKEAGSYTVRFDGGGLASGVYIYRLLTSNGVTSRTMELLK